MYFSELLRKGYKNQQPNRNTYDTHQFLWDMFKHDQGRRNFIYTNNGNKIYTVSKEKPRNLTSQNVEIRTKLYNPSFKEGDFLRFDIRFDPEVRLDEKRIPLVTAYKARLREGCKMSWNELMHEATLSWFNKHSKRYGFRIHDCFVQGYYHYDFLKKKSKDDPRNKSKKVKFDSLDLRGVLEVTGPAVFSMALHHGIGKARAFGCGLMLVAR